MKFEAAAGGEESQNTSRAPLSGVSPGDYFKCDYS